MHSEKILEIVEKRKVSIANNIEFTNILSNKEPNGDRRTLSETIKLNPDISIISEIKPASPTLGDIRNDINVKDVVIEMERAGVVGLSILTEPNYFNGSYENLKMAVDCTRLPCLMKDFVVDVIQFLIAKHLGATNILIINSITNYKLEDLYQMAQKFDLEPLIEIHNMKEIEDIRHLFNIGYEPKLIGINNRNLKTLEVNLNTSKIIAPKLREEFGANIQIISESGINSYEDIKFLLPYKIDGFLIGSSIMKSEKIYNKILSLRGLC